jgi:hypothetical protein
MRSALRHLLTVLEALVSDLMLQVIQAECLRSAVCLGQDEAQLLKYSASDRVNRNCPLARAARLASCLFWIAHEDCTDEMILACGIIACAPLSVPPQTNVLCNTLCDYI